MAVGLEWVVEGTGHSGSVSLLLDDGKTVKMIQAVDYVLSGLNPPIYELPFRSAKSENASRLQLRA